LCKMYLVDLSKDRSVDMSVNYLIDNSKDSCDSPDWPRVQLCKHIAAIAHFSTNGTIPTLDPTTLAATTPVPEVQQERSSREGGLASTVSVAPILENFISVSRDFLSDGLPSSPGTIQSLRMVESHLTAVIQNSRASQSSLPDRESLPPNQQTWTENHVQLKVGLMGLWVDVGLTLRVVCHRSCKFAELETMRLLRTAHTET
jgi:hypothetical protein